MTSIELRAIWSLNAIFSLRMLGIFMILPVISTYGMIIPGANESLIGLAIGIYGLLQAIFQIPCGVAADLIGRKPLIIFGLLMLAFGSIVAAMTNSILGVILGRALQGSSAISSVIMALLSDLIKTQNRNKAMALISINFSITFAMAMVLGPIITNAIGIQGLFWIIALFSLIGILVMVTIVPVQPVQNNIHNHLPLNFTVSLVYKNILMNPQLLKLNLSIFLLHAILMSHFIVLPSMLTSVGVLPADQWKIYLFTMLISFATMIAVYTNLKRNIEIFFINCVICILCAEIFFLTAGSNIFTLLFGIQVFFIAFSILETILPAMVIKYSSISYKATSMGVYSTSQYLGIAGGGMIGGYLFHCQGTCQVFIFWIIVTIAWLIVSYIINHYYDNK